MLNKLTKKFHESSSKSSNTAASLRSARSTQHSIAQPETPTPSPRQKDAIIRSDLTSARGAPLPPPHPGESKNVASNKLRSEAPFNEGLPAFESPLSIAPVETPVSSNSPSSHLKGYALEPISQTFDISQAQDSQSNHAENGLLSAESHTEFDEFDDDTSLFSSKGTDASMPSFEITSSHPYSTMLVEAVNDTPAFRASAEHIDVQFRALDQWLVELAVKSRKVVSDLMTVKDSVNDLIKLFMPGATHSSVLSHDYTTLLFGRYTELESTFWLDLVNTVSGNAIDTEKMVKAVREKSMFKYNKSRKDYILAVKDRDEAVSSLMRIPEGSEPAALRDVCFASHTAQVKYVKAATSLVVCITAVESEVTLSLLETLGHQYFDNGDGIQASSPSRFGMASDFFRLRIFAENLRADLPHLKSKLKRMRHALLKKTRHPRPSASLKDYSETELPFIENPQRNKCGWVNVEVKPKAWIMLWAYLSNGLFGFLGTSENRTAVIESARYPVSDLTFEIAHRDGKNSLFLVKFPNMQLVVQTQGKFELAEWEAAFKASQRLCDTIKLEAVTSNSTAEGNNYKPPVECLPWNRSFAIPGLFSAIAQGSDDVVAKIHELRNDMGARSWLCFDSSISCNENIVGGINVPSVKPLPTSVPLEVTAANCYFKPSGVPNAITSNVWGCLPGSNFEDINEIRNLAHYDGNFSRYPENYPRSLIYQDMDMRAIVSQLPAEERIEENDKLLFVVRCAIKLDGSEAPARMYVTSKKLIVYCTWSGLTHLRSIVLSSILDIELIDNVLCSNLNIESSSHSGEVTNLAVRLYIDSGVLVKKNLQIVVMNCKSNQPKLSQELLEPMILEMLDHFGLIKKNYELIQSKVVGENLTKALLESQMDRRNITSALLGSNSRAPIPSSSDVDEGGTNEFGDLRDSERGLRFKLAEDTFPVSTRTLFTTIFGPNSPVFNGYQSRVLESKLKAGPWYRKGKRVERRIVQLIHLPGDDGPTQKRYNYQSIEHQDNNVSIVKEKLSAWEMPRGDRFYSTLRYTVYRSELGSHLQIWCEIIWQKQVSGSEAESAVRSPHKVIAQNLILRIRDAVAKVNSLEDAQRMYGKVRPTKVVGFDAEHKDELAVTRVTAKSMAFIFARFSTANIFRRARWLILDGLYVTACSSGKFIFLIVITLLSLYWNYVLWSQSSQGYWDAVIQSQETDKLVNALNLAPNTENMVFKRALYLQDINEMIANNSIWASTRPGYNFLNETPSDEILEHHGCASKFAELVQYTNQEFGSLYEYEPRVKDVLDNLSALRLEFALKRNELSTIMRLLNAKEIEALQKMYRTWILEEAATCNKARITLQSLNASVLQDIRTYCMNCLEESKRFV